MSDRPDIYTYRNSSLPELIKIIRKVSSSDITGDTIGIYLKLLEKQASYKGRAQASAYVDQYASKISQYVDEIYTGMAGYITASNSANPVLFLQEEDQRYSTFVCLGVGPLHDLYLPPKYQDIRDELVYQLENHVGRPTF